MSEHPNTIDKIQTQAQQAIIELAPEILQAHANIVNKIADTLRPKLQNTESHAEFEKTIQFLMETNAKEITAAIERVIYLDLLALIQVTTFDWTQHLLKNQEEI